MHTFLHRTVTEYISEFKLTTKLTWYMPNMTKTNLVLFQCVTSLSATSNSSPTANHPWQGQPSSHDPAFMWTNKKRKFSSRV